MRPHGVMNDDTPQTPTTLADITDIAIGVEMKLHELLDSFELPGARLYGVNCAARPASEPNLCSLAQHPDVYELLDSPSSALARMFDAAAIVTTGWAAPLGPDGTVDGAPSEHALRRRVRLVVVVADHGVASVLRFADDPDDVVTDPGSATGSLADAITRFWFDPPINLPAITE
ncbi:MAG: hypothetical protein LW600_00525 [Ilumatobacteraceae bacterium]|nr:hypothetical protein [Ilumatobacteraceae bacterium]